MDMPCGGQGRCGKCRVTAQGKLSPLTEEEKRVLSTQDIDSGIRLACCTKILGDAEVRLANAVDGERIRINGVTREFHRDPLFIQYGAAIDIGTTTLAAQLYGPDGLLASAAAANPQRAFGADVISRIGQALSGKAAELAQTVRTAIAYLLRSMAQQAAIPVQEIDFAVITGNTAMLHLLTEQSPEPLAHSPFEAEELFGKFLPAESLGLPCKENAQVYLPRCMSAFVGADITTALLASGIYGQKETALLTDIGTNGEMALWHNQELVCCSTAAGPAFEGAGLSKGMPGAHGAIDHVSVRDGKVTVHILGGGPAKGICGSGIVDALAAMKLTEAMDETGCLADDEEEFPLADGVSVTQKDVRMVQLAKSAVCAGMRTLLHDAGVTGEELTQLAIAGGFGSFLDLHNAAVIGLYPAELEKKAKVLGNAALSGAAMLLQNRAFLEETAAMADSAKTLELSTNPVFMDAYVDCMEF